MLRRSLLALALSLAVAARAPAHDDPKITQDLGGGAYLVTLPTGGGFIGANIGFVVFDDFVLVIDAGFVPGARIALEEIGKVTNRPVRFVFDTHHHPDHSYGNGVFTALGATVIAHEQCAKIEREVIAPAYAKSAQDEAGKSRVAGAEFRAGTLTFHDRMVLEDGKQRVELIHFGHAHTPGDAVAWVPGARVLFSGDACVNGPFNNLKDSDSASWIRVLDSLAGLEPKVLAPGHGAIGDSSVIALQKRYFVELREQVARAIARGFSRSEVGKQLEMPWYREWTGVEVTTRRSDVDHVFDELSGVLPPNGLMTALGLRAGPSPSKRDADWTPPKKIIVPARVPLHYFAQVAEGVELVPVLNAAEAAQKAADADAVIGFLNGDILERGKKLRWVAVTSAGVERFVSLPQWGDRPITLTNAQRIHGPPIAEHVFAMLFAGARRLRSAFDAQREANWDVEPDRSATTELRGKTLFVVGLGGIGSEVAKIGHGLGMRVIATRRSVAPKPDFVERVATSEALLSFAAEADIVVNCLPLTKETERVFDEAFFSGVKKGAWFVNIGRGKSVVTDALVAALRDGRIGFAGLDVTDPEPLPADHPLWKLENVLITPHVSAGSDLADERVQQFLRENLRRFIAGEELLNVVDRTAGY